MNYYKRLPMKTITNTRDLGGYPCIGGITRYGVFLRANCPHNLEEDELEFLLRYAVKTSVDLRSEDECKETPSDLAKCENIRYYAISLMDAAKPQNLIENGKESADMGEFYIQMLENSKDEFKHLFEIFAHRIEKGTIIFNCAAGKDRTGVTAALLLKLVGVGDDDVIADYQVSCTYIRRKFKYMLDVVPKHLWYMLDTVPAGMEKTLDYITEKYGTAKDYLLHCGVAAEKLEKIAKELVAKG